MFKFCVKYVACGVSLRIVSNILSSNSNLIPQPLLRSRDDYLVAHYISVFTAVNCQQIADTVRDTWGSSITIDSATRGLVSYLKFRVCMSIPHIKSIENVHHLVAKGRQAHRLSNVLFVVNVLDVWESEWCLQRSSMSSDSAQNMTWLRLDHVTCLCQAALEYIYSIWCGVHQLNLVIANILGAMLNECIYSTLTASFHTLSAGRALSPTWARRAQNPSIVGCLRTPCAPGWCCHWERAQCCAEREFLFYAWGLHFASCPPAEPHRRFELHGAETS